jgi:hypothetical protein
MMVNGSIVCLLLSGGPAHVFLEVAFGPVDAIDGVAGIRTTTNVTQEVFKRANPRRVNSDARTTVSGETLVLGIEAPALHRLP